MNQQAMNLDPDVASTAVELRMVIGNLRRRMRQEGQPGDFTPSQLAALTRLESDGPLTVTAVARAEGVRPQTMGATIAALEAAGWVVGTPDPRDGRQTLRALSEVALAEVRQGRAAKENWLFRAIRTTLTPAEQKQLGAAVDLLKRLAAS